MILALESNSVHGDARARDEVIIVAILSLCLGGRGEAGASWDFRRPFGAL